jgi:hypothetical protein
MYGNKKNLRLYPQDIVAKFKRGITQESFKAKQPKFDLTCVFLNIWQEH